MPRQITHLRYDPYTGTFTVTRQIGKQMPQYAHRISPLVLSNIGDMDINGLAEYAMRNPGRDHVVGHHG